MPFVDPLVTSGTTFINPLGMMFTVLMGILLVVLPRRYAILPIIILICYMTMGMRLMIGGLNFTMLRFVLPFGWIRLASRGELKGIKLNPIDKTLLVWVCVMIVAYTLLWQTFDAFKYKLGFAYDVVGFYFMFRFLVRDLEEVTRTVRMYSFAILPLAAAMVVEKLTGRNSFSIFGGVPLMTVVREGALRCQGPFSHPILAGTFGATLMPLFVGLWWQGRKRLIPALAILGASIMTFTSASSGPVLMLMFGFFVLPWWFLRKQMRKVRWGIVMGFVGLQLVMKAPVWFVLARIDLFQGSTGYHRAFLIDRAIANLPGWWLVGTKSTWDWAGRDNHLFDVTNQYIQYGADGGLLTMILFIVIIVFGFKSIGRTVRLGEGKEPKENLRMIWALGSSMMVHCATYFSVSYFDQNAINWYLLLAMISTVAGSSLLLSRQDFLAQLDSQTVGESSGVAAWNSMGPAPIAGQARASTLPSGPDSGLNRRSRFQN